MQLAGDVPRQEEPQKAQNSQKDAGRWDSFGEAGERPKTCYNTALKCWCRIVGWLAATKSCAFRREEESEIGDCRFLTVRQSTLAGGTTKGSEFTEGRGDVGIRSARRGNGPMQLLAADFRQIQSSQFKRADPSRQ
jgi:hypothetical protein